MPNIPQLSRQEWSIVVDLLEGERHNLPAVIHHASGGEAKSGLRERLRTVEQILGKVRPAATMGG
jgi:hypothetical protein